MSTYSKVKIKPYIEKGKSNMGLERYGMAVADKAIHTIEMACVQEGDSIRYITGVNPFAPEVKLLPDEERIAKEEQIKKIVIAAEKAIGNVIKDTDEDWFSKTKRTKPDNLSFWSHADMQLKLSNEDVPLDPARNVIDLLLYTAIKAGGFPEVAANLEEARSRSRTVKFYLDEVTETASLKTEVTKLRNKAGAELQKLYDKNSNKLLYVLKVIDANSTQYKKSTPLDVMYENADNYINGSGVEDDKRKTAQKFLEVAELDMETLKLRALVKDATFYNFLSLKGDGMIYHMQTGSAMGKNPTQVVEYLKNPLNEQILETLLKRVEAYWKE